MLDKGDGIETTNFFLKNIKYLKKLKTIINDYNPDVVLSFLPEPCYRTLLIKRYIKAPVIISVRNDPNVEYNNILKKILMKVLYCRADGYVFQTEQAKTYFPNKMQKRSTIIVNPVDDKVYKVKYTPCDLKQVVNVGRLTEQKNQLLLIKSFMKVIDKHPDAQLLIYGDGPLKDNLQSFIISNKLDNNVKLCGEVDNIQETLKDKMCFVLSSNYEGMPNSLLEAMAVGLPCIATDCPCGGTKEIITNNEDGILVEVGNESQLSEAIIELINDQNKRNYLSKNAKKNMERFKPTLVYKNWQKYIEEVIKKWEK